MSGDENGGVLSEPAPVVNSEQVQRLLRDEWGIESAALNSLPSERDRNVRVDDAFVLKVSNPAEPEAEINMEVAAMAMGHVGHGCSLPLVHLSVCLAAHQTVLIRVG